MFSRIAILLAAVAVTAAPALAQTAPDLNERTVSYDGTYDVNADGTYTLTIRDEVQLLTPTGVERGAQRSRGYAAGLQALRVVSAETIKADGRHVNVPDASVFDRSVTSGDELTFGDERAVSVVFPDVAPGDRVAVTWEFRQLKPLFPGQFTLRDLVSPLQAVEANTVTVRAPASLPLHWNATPGYTVTERVDGDSRVLRATARNAVAMPGEPGMTCPCDAAEQFVVTTFDSWEAVGAAYWARARAAARVTPAVRELAASIAPEATGLEFARAAHGWVTSNIRYVALNFGDGAVVPRDADDIIHSRFGDCKDDATLLIALLAARGVRAEPVLTTTYPTYHPALEPTPAQFNHVIAYLPDFKVYVDPTDRRSPFGTLPPADLAKFVVHAGDAPRAAVTPGGDPTRDAYTLDARLELRDDGTVIGAANLRFTGALESPWRAALADVTAAVAPRVVASVLGATGERGTGSLESSGVHDLDRPVELNVRWSSPGALTIEAGVPFALPAGFNAYPAAAFEPAVTLESRAFPIAPGAGGFTWTTRFVPPVGFRFERAPAGSRVVNDAGEFTASYSMDGADLVVTRRLVIARDVYDPAALPSLRALVLALQRDARSRVTLIGL